MKVSITKNNFKKKHKKKIMTRRRREKNENLSKSKTRSQYWKRNTSTVKLKANLWKTQCAFNIFAVGKIPVPFTLQVNYVTSLHIMPKADEYIFIRL